MAPPAENMKSKSERIARTLADATTLSQVDQILAEEGKYPPPRQGPGPSPRPTLSKTRRIGIWEPRQENGRTSYIRNADGPFAGLWANVERIDPKEGRKRVLLFGESVARGIFYEPFLNPAQVLEKILAGILIEPVEVIDLARSDIGMYELRMLIESALDLDPDGIVIFAGNNWRLPDGSDSYDLVETAKNVKDSGDWEQVTARARGNIDSNIASLLRLLRYIIGEMNIPVVFILPEFNLMDWQNEFCGQSPFMGASDLNAWQIWKKEAESSLIVGDLANAESLARCMIMVDAGLLPIGYEILARCRLSAGDTYAARDFLELARDASQFLPIHQSPRCYGTIQQTLRRDAERHGVHLVNLPRLFEKRFNSAIPGRELFLDYCHMTSSGIFLAMAAAAKELLSASGIHWNCTGQSPFTVHIPVEPTVEAHAHFLAAIHNARCGQPYEIIRQHCETALEYERGTAETMRLYIKACLGPVPLLMAKSFWDMNPSARVALTSQPMLRSMKPDREILWPLVHAIRDLLGETFPDIGNEIFLMLRQEFAIAGTEDVNLLRKPFCSPGACDLERNWEQRSTCFAAYSRCSEFWFPVQADVSVRVDLTCRVPAPAAEKDYIRVFLDDVLIHTIPASEKWQSSEFLVPADARSRDSARIIINWPQPRWTREERINQIVQNIELGPISSARAGFPEIFARFGEIQAMTATCSPQVASAPQEITEALVPRT